MSHDRVYQRLRSHLAYLKLPAAAEALAGKLDAAQKAKPSYTAFTEDLLGVEVEATERRRMAGRLRFAHFPGSSAWRTSTSTPSRTSTAAWSRTSRRSGSSERRPTC